VLVRNFLVKTFSRHIHYYYMDSADNISEKNICQYIIKALSRRNRNVLPFRRQESLIGLVWIFGSPQRGAFSLSSRYSFVALRIAGSLEPLPLPPGRTLQSSWAAKPSMPKNKGKCRSIFPSSLLRFASKTSKNRRLGDFLPYKLRKEPINRGFCGTK
jgi:hypothetical protein